MISNPDIARILFEIGEYLEMQQTPFKPRAYQKASDVISAMQEEVSTLYARGGLKALLAIPGVGQAIAEKIQELLETGKLRYYEQLKKKTPVNLAELSSVEGLGPKRIQMLYQKLKVRNLKDLEKAAKAGKISALPAFGKKSEGNILKGIEFVKSSGGRAILGFMTGAIAMLEQRLQKLKFVDQAIVAGSARRKKETIGDIDILATSKKPRQVIEFFIKMPEVGHVYAAGDTKANVRFKNGMDVDLRVVPHESYGAALHYFTGSKDHNVAVRELALKKGMTLNEYGLFKVKGQRSPPKADPPLAEKVKTKGVRIAGKTEEEVYRALGLNYIEPELREMTGELEAAKTHQLPQLINYGSLKGDLQIQTSWTDGAVSIEVMARQAASRGLEYIAITDHSKRLAMANGLTEKRLLSQGREIDKLNAKFSAEGGSASGGKVFRVLKGIECDILKDGSLDLPDEALARLDVVGVSVHSYFNLPMAEQTKRVIKAMQNPHVDILFHPTGRKIQQREPIALDIDAVIAAAKETKTVLEIDAFPDRSDLKDEYIKKAVMAGVKLAIDSDSHDPRHLAYLDYGISQARRGWAQHEDIINAYPVEKMLSFLKDAKR